MINAALNLVPQAVGQGRPQIIPAVVAPNTSRTPLPSAFTDSLFVTSPTDSESFWEVKDWTVDHGGTLPQAGAACALFYDSSGALRCLWWDGLYTPPVGIEPSGGDDTADINDAILNGDALGAGTYLISGLITGVPRGQGPGLTILQATSSAAAIQAGPNIGTLPTSDTGTYGNFTFDGNNLTTVPALLLNTSGTRLGPIVIKNVLGDGLVVAGQNCLVVAPNIAFVGGSGIVYDNGCGNNTIFKPQVSRCAQYHHESRQTVAPPSGAYGVPTYNTVYDPQYEYGSGSNLGCYHQLAGSFNFFVGNVNFFSPLNVSLVLLEPNTVSGRSGDANGRLYFQGSATFTGNNTGVGVGIEANAVSGGVAGVLPNGLGGSADVGVFFQGERVFSGLNVAQKWGTSTPIWARSPITKYNVATEFQTNGTGAATSVVNPDTQYRLAMPWIGGGIGQGTAAGTLIPVGTALAVFATQNTSPMGIVYLDPADYPGFGTLNYRVKAVLATNGTAPGVNFTFGLYPVTAVGGTSNINTLTLGTVVSGSTVTFTTPALGTASEADSGDFVAPAAGNYVLAVASSGTTATSSSTMLRVCLQQHRK